MAKKYDSTLARMAGNMAADLIRTGEMPDEMIAQITVRVARAIMQEVIRTTPSEAPEIATTLPGADYVPVKGGQG